MPSDARRIRARLVPGRRMVCIGAGVIGLELAGSAKARGCAVDVVEAGPSIMGRCVAPGIAADCVIAGIGMERNVELAAAAGLAVGNGTLVDEPAAPAARTSMPRATSPHPGCRVWHGMCGWNPGSTRRIAVGRAMADAGAS